MSDVDPMADRVSALVEVESKVGEVLVQAVERTRTNQRTIRLIVVSLVIDVLLSAGLGAEAVVTRHVARQAQQASSAVVVSCEAGNDFRQLERELWGYVFSISPVTPQTPEQRAQTDQFKQYIAMTFAARDCAHIIK